MSVAAVMLASAFAADAPQLPDPVPDYPVELPRRGADFETWDRAYWKSRRLGWAANGLTGGGLVGIGLGAALIDGAGGAAALTLLVAVPTHLTGPPLLLASSMRGARALRERGVRVSSVPAVVGWTLLGVSPIAAAVGTNVTPGVLTYAGAIGCGLVQQRINDRRRRNAGLPDVRP